MAINAGNYARKDISAGRNNQAMIMHAATHIFVYGASIKFDENMYIALLRRGCLLEAGRVVIIAAVKVNNLMI